jgi:hypothetical protein
MSFKGLESVIYNPIASTNLTWLSLKFKSSALLVNGLG